MTTAAMKMETRAIDGADFDVAYMSVSQAMQFADDLAKLLAPMAGELPKGSDVLDRKVTLAFALDVVVKALHKVDGKKTTALIANAMQYVIVHDEEHQQGLPLKGNFDAYFQGKLDTLFRVFKFFLEVQYGSFFKLLPEGALQALKA